MKKNIKFLLSGFAISSAIIATPVILNSNKLEQKNKNNYNPIFSSSRSMNLYKDNDFSFKEKLPSTIQWHKINTNKIKIDTKLNQYGAILQYKNGGDWKNISSNGIIENLNSSPILFRWTNDSSHKLRAFSAGDGSGNTYTQKQLDMRGVVKPAPEGVKPGDVVTQANIDKRDGHTITGLEIPKSIEQKKKKTVLFEEKPFGIEDDKNKNERVFWYRDNKALKKEFEINKGFLINGNSLKFSFEIYGISNSKYSPSIEDFEKDISGSGFNKTSSYSGNLIISYDKTNKKFNYKLSYRYLSEASIKNDTENFTQNINSNFSKIRFYGLNSKSNSNHVGLDLEIKEKNKNMFNFKIHYIFDNETGEDALYFKKIKLVSLIPTNEQIAALEANFKARANDKLGYKYTEDEIWMRDHGSKLSKNSILGLNKKDIYSKKTSTIILLEAKSIIQSSDINSQMQKAISDKNNKFFLGRKYTNKELIATDELLGLDSDIVSVLPNQTLQNGLNRIIVKTKDGFIFEDGKNSKVMKINIKNRFYSVVSLLNFKTKIYHKDNSTFEITNKSLGITSKEFKIAPGTKVKKGMNKVKLIAENGFVFANHKMEKIVNLEVVNNKKEEIEKQLEYFKNKMKDAKITNQGWSYLSEISRQINNANNINEKLEILKKISGIELQLKKDNTKIVDIIAYTEESKLILEFNTYSTDTVEEFTKNTFKVILKGKGNKIIAEHFHKNNIANLEKNLKGLKIKQKKQAYRFLSDIALTITNIDSLSNFLDLNIQSIIKGSVLKNIHATSDNGNIVVTGILHTKFALKDTPFKYIFKGGKLDSEINQKVEMFNQLQKKDVDIIKKRINDQLPKLDNYLEMNNMKTNSYKSQSIESIHTVYSLKENLGIDLNIDLQASIIRSVSLFKNQKGDLVLDVFLYTHKAAKNNMIVDYIIKTEPAKHSAAYNVLVIFVSIALPSFIIMALFYFSSFNKYRR
ncbi:MAG: hypothetical protein GY679_03255 [Mycoplasma sp.]|nr:hypothetical protein [Mycoplasma sp.]